MLVCAAPSRAQETPDRTPAIVHDRWQENRDRVVYRLPPFFYTNWTKCNGLSPMHRCRCAERPKDTELRLVGPQDKHRGRHQPRRGFCNNILVSSTYWYLFIITARSLHLSAQGETHLIGKLIAKFPAQPAGPAATGENGRQRDMRNVVLAQRHNEFHRDPAQHATQQTVIKSSLPSSPTIRATNTTHTHTQTQKPSRCCTVFFNQKTLTIFTAVTCSFRAGSH